MNRSTLSKITFYFLLLISINNYKLIAQVKIGEKPTEVSTFAILELESSNKGLLLPRLTTSQRDQAFNQQTPEGMLIFNTDRQQLQYFFYDINPLTGKKTSLKKWGNSEEEIYTIVPENPKPGTLFYNQITKILYLWDKTLALWLPLNYNTAASSVTLGVEDPTMESASLEGNGSNHIRELIISESTPKTADLKDVNPGILFAETRFGNLYLATDRNQDGTSDSWRRINGVSSSGSTQSLSASLEDQVLILKLSGGVGETSVDLSSLTQEGNQITGTDTQTLSFDTGSATSSQTTLNLQGSQSLTLITSGTLSLSNTDSTTLMLSATDLDQQSLTASFNGSHLVMLLENSNDAAIVDLSSLTGTDTQTLSFDTTSATATQTKLNLQGSQSLTLLTSGTLSLSNTDSTTLLLSGTQLGSAINPGNTLHSTLRWEGSDWIENTTLLSDGSGQATLTTNLDVEGTVSVNQRIGIGTSSPNNKLELVGTSVEDRTVAINQTPVIYLPDTSTYNGSFAIGDGLRNLQNGGLGNTAVGIGALTSNTIGKENTAIGKDALKENLSGRSNTAIGFDALKANVIGRENIAVGNGALYRNTEGFFNIAIGNASLSNNISGIDNIAIGNDALISNIQGGHNIGLGFQSIKANTEGNYNIGIGYQSLYSNSSGGGNIALGQIALVNNINGSDNIAIGNQSLYRNKLGSRGIAIGEDSQRYVNNNNTTDWINTNVSIGFESLRGSSYSQYNNGINNTAIGYHTMVNNSSGEENTAIGFSALKENINGYNNTAVGVEALTSNENGFNNTANGMQALSSNTSGSMNTAIGYYTSYSNTTGHHNTVIGSLSMNSIATGSNNTAIGSAALGDYTSGSYLIAIGSNAGQSDSGNATSATNSIFIGSSAHPANNDETNQIVIGHEAEGRGSNTITIGNSATVDYLIYGTPQMTSDSRLKHGIRPLQYGLDFIQKLNPVAYIMNNRSDEKQDYGFIAQEIQSLLNTYGDSDSDLVNVINQKEKTLGLKYINFIPILTKAIQELSIENNNLKSEILALDSSNSQLLESYQDLLKRIQSLEENE